MISTMSLAARTCLSVASEKGPAIPDRLKHLPLAVNDLVHVFHPHLPDVVARVLRELGVDVDELRTHVLLNQLADGRFVEDGFLNVAERREIDAAEVLFLCL